jgi:hypothetical protein
LLANSPALLSRFCGCPAAVNVQTASLDCSAISEPSGEYAGLPNCPIAIGHEPLPSELTVTRRRPSSDGNARRPPIAERLCVAADAGSAERAATAMTAAAIRFDVTGRIYSGLMLSL